MKRRKSIWWALPAVLLTVCLLASAATPTVAESVMVTDLTEVTYAAHAIPATESLLKASNCSRANEWPSLYDGDACGWNNSAGHVATKDAGGAGEMWISYDLGLPHEIDSFLLAGGTEPEWGGGIGTGVYGFDLYIGDKDIADVQAGDVTPVYSTKDSILTARRIDFENPIVGQYVVLRLGGLQLENRYNWGAVWMTEIAALGKEVGGIKVTDLTEVTYAAQRIPKADNLLNELNSDYAGDYPMLYDGEAFSWNGSTHLNMRDPDGGGDLWITYDLKGGYAIDSFLLAGGTEPDWGGGIGTGAYGFDLYVSNLTGEQLRDDPTLQEPVYSTDDTVIYPRKITFDEPPTGWYLVLRLGGLQLENRYGWGQLWLSEVAATGELKEEPPQTAFTDPETGCTMAVEMLNYADRAFFENIGGLQVEKSPCPTAEGSSGRLTVLPQDGNVYTFRLLDKQGDPLTRAAFADREIRVTVPAVGDGMQGLGFWNGTGFERIRNSLCFDGQVSGTLKNADRLQFVLLTFDTANLHKNGVISTGTGADFVEITEEG